MNTPQPFPKSPSYRATMSGLLRMHQLSLAGQEESEEADRVRESMCDPWEGLSKTEKERFTGLSKDLYEISDGSARDPEPMNPQAQGKIVGVYEARERGEWDKALELLRRWGKYLPAALVAYMRGSIWRSSGEPEAAAAFFEFASRLEPENDNYQAILLQTLNAANPTVAVERAKIVLQVSESRSPAVVAFATEIVLGQTDHLSDSDALAVYKQLIPILESTLTRLDLSEDIDGPVLSGMILSQLASSYRNIGDTRKACHYYSRAIQLNPTNDALLIARGILLYGTDPNATVDFERAIQLGSSLVWPYYYLAHAYLQSNRFEDCRVICERALHTKAPARIQSEIYEFQAISLAGLAYPESVIMRMFENAIRVDPSNERARRNWASFEAALATRTAHTGWERISDSSMRKTGQQAARADLAYFEKRTPLPV